VDFANGRLRVERSEWNGQVTVPKNGRFRSVPLTNRLTEALREHRHQQHLRNRRVLCHVDGTPFTRQYVQSRMRSVSQRAGVRRGVHILRHTFCSHLAMRGAPAASIQALAGHQDLSTTQRYMHVSQGALDDAIHLLNKCGNQRGTTLSRM
jgi:site-specific recombinase XerD